MGKPDSSNKVLFSKIDCLLDSNNEEVSFQDFPQPTHLKSLRNSNLIIWGEERYGNPSIAGYNPRNGDFEFEFANNAEEVMCVASHLYDYTVRDRQENNQEEEKLMKELQVALVGVYNSTLREREVKKKIIREHGLLNLKGTRLWYSRLEKTHGLIQAKKLIKLTRLMTTDEAELFYSSVECVNDMRFQMNRLTFYRAQFGISTLTDLGIFEREKKKRKPKGERLDLRSLILPQFVKKKKPSLEIFHLPRFKELTSLEAELCSSVGVLPELFLTAKGALLSDCKKNNGMLLKKARKMVKIDVNKTRKIFDFLMEQGVLWPPANKGGYG